MAMLKAKMESGNAGDKAFATATNDEDMKQKGAAWLVDFPAANGLLAADGHDTVVKWAKENAVVVITDSTAEGALAEECAVVVARVRQISTGTVEKDLSSLKKAQRAALQSYLSQNKETCFVPCVLIHGRLLDLPSTEDGGISAVDLGPLVHPVNASTARDELFGGLKQSPPVNLTVSFQGKEFPMVFESGMRGAIFKSQVMALVGTNNEAATSNFGSYTLDLDGHPFAGREPVSTHPGWKEGCSVVLKKREEGEDKRAGTT